MNKLILYLFKTFMDEHKSNLFILIILSLILSFIKIFGISYVVSGLCDSIYENNFDDSCNYFKYLVIMSLSLLIVFSFYKYLQNYLLYNLREWIKLKIIDKIFDTNYENLKSINFQKLNTPILRISTNSYYILNDVITTYIPDILLIITVTLFLFYKNQNMGLTFIIGNLIMLIYSNYLFDNILNLNDNYEKSKKNNESYLVEILNNINKIIYRGNIKEETTTYQNILSDTIKLAQEYNNTIDLKLLNVNLIMHLTVFILIGSGIYLYFNKTFTNIEFVAILTILLIYRDKLLSVLEKIPDLIEFYSKISSINSNILDTNFTENYKNNLNTNINFNNIKFQNVTFKYDDTTQNIFTNLNLEFNLNDIISLNGDSGKGKSTLMKLLIKMHNYNGNIFIDNINIKDIDTDYIRNNIVYIDQHSKLFDKKIIDNILYACNENNNICLSNFAKIKKFPKITELLDKLNIYDNYAGLDGNNLSGGQKHIINIINGLILPSKIVILDEPTTGLDNELKDEVINLIKYFKQSKKCIIIISHDKSINSIINKTIKI